MLIFLDTEFTDLGPESELLSIGLITEDGHHEFYSERNDYDLSSCSEFVRAAVLPLLGKDPKSACSKDDLTHRIRAFLKQLPAPVSVACDYYLDWDYFIDTTTNGGELDLPEMVNPQRFRFNEWVFAPLFTEAAEDYFRAGNPRHHALHDARANRKGYLAAKESLLARFLG